MGIKQKPPVHLYTVQPLHNNHSLVFTFLEIKPEVALPKHQIFEVVTADTGNDGRTLCVTNKRYHKFTDVTVTGRRQDKRYQLPYT